MRTWNVQGLDWSATGCIVMLRSSYTHISCFPSLSGIGYSSRESAFSRPSGRRLGGVPSPSNQSPCSATYGREDNVPIIFAAADLALRNIYIRFSRCPRRAVEHTIPMALPKTLPYYVVRSATWCGGQRTTIIGVD